MTIQIARSNTSGNVPTSLQDGQLAINQADGVLFSRNPDGTVKRTLLPKRAAVADAAFTVRFFDSYIGIASLTASRTIALPAAAAYPPGFPLTIADESGSCSPTVVVTIAANGTDKVNGVGSVALNSPYGEAVLISDGVSKWVANLPASGASNAVLYVAQSLTGGQQDQARANVSGPMAATTTATTTLGALDYDRDQFVTGTSALTMPGSVAPGWRSGKVTNDNAITGLVTLAVPSGHSLDGVANGNTILFPKQRARLRLVSAGAWRTDWIERSPIVALANVVTATSAIDLDLPVGYSRFLVRATDLVMTAGGANLGWRVSDNGTAGIKSGTNDYSSEGLSVAASSTFPGPNVISYGMLAANVGANAQFRAEFQMQFTPGATGVAASMISKGVFIDNSASVVTYDVGGYYAGTTSGAIGRANRLRIFNTSVNLVGNVTVVGEP